MKKDRKNDENENMMSACEEALQCGIENGDILAESSDDLEEIDDEYNDYDEFQNCTENFEEVEVIRTEPEDEIHQLDGFVDSESEEETVAGPSGWAGSSLQINSDSEDDQVEASPFNVEFNFPDAEYTFDEKERKHVVYPKTGKPFVFISSHLAKPSTIKLHVNDIFNIMQV